MSNFTGTPHELANQLEELARQLRNEPKEEPVREFEDWDPDPDPLPLDKSDVDIAAIIASFHTIARRDSGQWTDYRVWFRVQVQP